MHCTLCRISYVFTWNSTCKDVDLYSTSDVQDTSNTHFVTETEPPGRLFTSPPIACKHRPAQWPNNRPQAAPASSRSTVDLFKVSNWRFLSLSLWSLSCTTLVLRYIKRLVVEIVININCWLNCNWNIIYNCEFRFIVEDKDNGWESVEAREI